MKLSEEHRLIRDSVRRFTKNEIIPFAEQMDRDDYLQEGIFLKFGSLGILGITIPEEYGGAGGDLLSQVLITEELAKGSGGVALSYVAHSNLCAHNLHTHGNEFQRKKYLPYLCTGEKIGALGLTEPEAGSDAMGIQTKAVRDGDIFRLNGTKTFITNAPIADTFLIYTKTPNTNRSKAITAFIVERSFTGLSTSEKFEKMGCKPSPTGEIVLDDCIVPVENVLGEENDGVSVMMAGLDIERVAVAAISLGIAESAFEDSLKYSKIRKQFGQPICNFQLIQAKLADMYTGIAAARLLVYDTAIRSDREEKLRKESAAAVLFTAEMATKVCLEAIQIHGGNGYMLESAVSRYLGDAKLLEIGAGTGEIRRILIAKELLKH
jgi:isovaleryl-CoA dehydrogenase